MRRSISLIFGCAWCLAACFVWCGLARAVPPKRECLAAYSSAQELRLGGALLAAREKLLLCSQRGCPVPVVNDCAGWLGEVEGALPSAVFAVSDETGRDIPDARVSTAGRVLAERTDGHALWLDPGTYTFTFEARGYARTQRTVSMRQAEKDRLVRVQLRKLSPQAAGVTRVPSPREVAAQSARQAPAVTDESTGSRGVPVTSLVLGGVAVLSAASFAYFGLRGLGKKHDAERCQSMCRELIDSGKRDYVIADISVGIALASVSAALVVYLLRPHAPAAVGGQSAQSCAPMPYLRSSF